MEGRKQRIDGNKGREGKEVERRKMGNEEKEKRKRKRR